MRAVTTTVLLLAGALTVAAPAVAQIGGGAGPRYPYQSNPIDRAYQDVQKPLPRLPAAPPPDSRWVPERRVTVPGASGTRKEVVIPAHEERRISDTQVTVPPLTGYGPGGPVHIPGGDRPPAELRQAP
jgi:hypothetical protein